jgi:hypothetical protein
MQKPGKPGFIVTPGKKPKKEQAIRNRFPVRLEAALDKLNTGLDKKARSKTSRKYSNALAGYVKKTAASHQITVSRSLPMMKKTTPSVSNGCVNPKVNKKTSTAVFTA